MSINKFLNLMVTELDRMAEIDVQRSQLLDKLEANRKAYGISWRKHHEAEQSFRHATFAAHPEKRNGG